MREIILAIFSLGVLVGFHELGHFLVGKRKGVYVHEFGIGMGPVVFSWTRGETKYTIRAVPMGGFCRFAGGDPREDADDAHIPEDRKMTSKSPGTRALVVLGGPAANLLIAAVAFFLVFSVAGVSYPTTSLAEVMVGYPAEVAGMEVNDTVISIEGAPIESWAEISEALQARSGMATSLVVERAGQEMVITVTPIDVNGSGIIGIRPQAEKRRMSPLTGLYEGVKETVIISVLWVQGIIGMIAGSVPAEVTGPIGIAQVLGEAARTGFGELMYLVGALSANLGLINLLPIPALDGSRLLFFAYEAIRGKPVDPEKENMVHFIGFFLLISLILFITYKDIVRLVR